MAVEEAESGIDALIARRVGYEFEDKLDVFPGGVYTLQKTSQSAEVRVVVQERCQNSG